jgi:hypothetical protein
MFRQEVTSWHQLRHPYVLPFLGIDNTGITGANQLSMVSPWMINGSINEYTRKTSSGLVASLDELVRNFAHVSLNMLNYIYLASSSSERIDVSSRRRHCAW